MVKDLNDSQDPKHTLFCREIVFVAIYAFFSDNKCPLFTRLWEGGRPKGTMSPFFIAGLPLASMLFTTGLQLRRSRGLESMFELPHLFFWSYQLFTFSKSGCATSKKGVQQYPVKSESPIDSSPHCCWHCLDHSLILDPHLTPNSCSNAFCLPRNKAVRSGNTVQKSNANLPWCSYVTNWQLW